MGYSSSESRVASCAIRSLNKGTLKNLYFNVKWRRKPSSEHENIHLGMGCIGANGKRAPALTSYVYQRPPPSLPWSNLFTIVLSSCVLWSGSFCSKQTQHQETSLISSYSLIKGFWIHCSFKLKWITFFSDIQHVATLMSNSLKYSSKVKIALIPFEHKLNSVKWKVLHTGVFTYWLIRPLVGGAMPVIRLCDVAKQ